MKDLDAKITKGIETLLSTIGIFCLIAMIFCITTNG
jgi:hypothetical protein